MTMYTTALIVASATLSALNPMAGATLVPHSARLHRRFTFVAQPAPQNWSTDSLEDYDQYHFRYLSIGCHQKKDDQEFFDNCCHPRLKTENLENIPVECHLDTASMIKANEYILNSTDDKGEIASGEGKPIYVQKADIKVMQPAPGRNASDVPTASQISQIIKTQARIATFNQVLANSSDIANLNLTSNVTAFPLNATALPGNVTLDVSANSTMRNTLAVIATSADNVSQNTTASTAAAAEAAAKARATADAVAAAEAKTKADSEAAAKVKAASDAAAAAAEKAAADAKAKADSDAAAKAQAAADAAAAIKAQQTADAAAAAKSTDKSNSVVDTVVSSLAGTVGQVFGSDGSAKGTFFYQGGAAGACGNVNSDSTPLVALPTAMYEDGKHCGKNVMIKNTANGQTVVAKVQDMCPGCPSATSLDLSTGAFDALGSQSTGVLPIEWGYM